jgi:hypothetical protein
MLGADGFPGASGVFQNVFQNVQNIPTETKLNSPEMALQQE